MFGCRWGARAALWSLLLIPFVVACDGKSSIPAKLPKNLGDILQKGNAFKSLADDYVRILVEREDVAPEEVKQAVRDYYAVTSVWNSWIDRLIGAIKGREQWTVEDAVKDSANAMSYMQKFIESAQAAQDAITKKRSLLGTTGRMLNMLGMLTSTEQPKVDPLKLIPNIPGWVVELLNYAKQADEKARDDLVETLKTVKLQHYWEIAKSVRSQKPEVGQERNNK